MADALLIIGSFAIGSLPFSFWLTRWVAGLDLRHTGSGNPGASNVLRVAGAGPAAAALVLDVTKGLLPVAAAVRLEAGDAVIAATGVAAVLGHVVSPFLGFRGGKGVATAFGALSVLHPLAAAVGAVTFLFVVVWRRYVSLGSLSAAVAAAAVAGASQIFSLANAGFGRPGTLAVVAIVLIVIARHGENVRRLAAGTEEPLGGKASLS